MNDTNAFERAIQQGYSFSEPALHLGTAFWHGEVHKPCPVCIPLNTLNRHGLIAGATGTGKTKTIQVLCEQMAHNQIPVVMMDIKGDFSGIAQPGDVNQQATERYELAGKVFEPASFPVEFYSLTHAPGIKLRTTLLEFGPLLFSRMLDLSDAQQGIVTMAFKYAEDQALPLIDLSDFKKVLQFITQEGKESMEQEYGKVSASSAGVVLRKIMELEQQGANLFFGEPSFDVLDFLSTHLQPAKVHVVRLHDMQDKPILFSTFMLSLLAEIYEKLPEVGDLDKPKLCFIFDEAHFIFEFADKALQVQLEQVVKLIRSKGVGIFFCTQNPTDIPGPILSQLGLKIQHALRAFTANDRKAIRLVAQNYPDSVFYNTEETLTELGIGQAFVTGLNPKGIPTPLVICHMLAPQSRMRALSDAELVQAIAASGLTAKYATTLDSESAFELLTKRLETLKKEAPDPPATKRHEKNIGEVIGDAIKSQVGRSIAREITRGLMGVLGLGKRR